jgi:hypothetical protein
MTIDLSRLTVLGTISARENAALEKARATLDVELSTSKEVRRQLLAEQRRDGSAGERGSIRRRIDQLRAKQGEIDQRIEDQEASIELLQERATAAHRLRKTCEAWAAQHVQSGGAQ